MIEHRTGRAWAARAALGAVLLLTTGPRAAQALVPQPPSAPANGTPASPPPDTGSEIIVIGRDMPDIAKIRALTRAITRVDGDDKPIARFADPICVATLGLSGPLLVEVADRLLADAQDAGIRLAGDKCRPNVAILFVDDGRAELQRLRRSRPDLVGVSPHDFRAIVATPGPVHAFTNTETRSRDGDPIFVDGVTGLPNLTVPSQSRVVFPIRRDMVSSLVLIDRAALAGLTSRQIADYAAMRAFASVRPERAGGGDTILTLFATDAGPRPAEMTPFDRAYLKALYAGAGNQRPGAKIAGIARTIDRAAHGETGK